MDFWCEYLLLSIGTNCATFLFVSARDGRDGKDGKPGPRGMYENSLISYRLSPPQQWRSSTGSNWKHNYSCYTWITTFYMVHWMRIIWFSGFRTIGHRGPRGPPGHNGGGVEYIRWGKTSCPYGANKVYKGQFFRIAHSLHSGGLRVPWGFLPPSLFQPQCPPKTALMQGKSLNKGQKHFRLSVFLYP